MNYRTLVEDYFENFKQDLADIIAIESTRDVEHAGPGAPFGPKVREVLELMLEKANRDGFNTKNYDGYAGLITYGEGEESVGVLGHLDIVPLGDGWHHDPLIMSEDSGYLFGRGVLDDKGPFLASYYALKMLKDLNVPLKRKVMLIAGTDEESGMGGIAEYVKTGPIPTMGFTPDADFPVVYGEKGNLHIALDSDQDTIIESFTAGTRVNIVIEKATATLNTDQFDENLFKFFLNTNDVTGHGEVKDGKVVLEVIGKAAHASTPYLGKNAALILFNYIGQAYNDQLSKELYSLLWDWKGTPEAIDVNGVYMGFLTMNTGLVSIENGHTHVLVDIRYPNDTNVETISKGFEQACLALDNRITHSVAYAGDPLFVDPNSDLVQNLMAAYRKYSGDTFRPAITLGGGTYAKMFDNFVAFGPEKPWVRAPKDLIIGGIHDKDEGVEIESLKEAIAIYADAIERLANQ